MNYTVLLGWVLLALGVLGLAGVNVLFTLPAIAFGALALIGEYIVIRRKIAR